MFNDFLRTLGFRHAAGAITQAQTRFFHEQGYLILPRFFEPALMSAMKEHLDDLWNRRASHKDLVIDIYFDLPGEQRTHFSKAPADARAAPYKLLDLHLQDPLIQDLSASARLTQVLGQLLGAHPLVCNSLLFERGSQQYPHFDTFFMPSKTPNMMAASWIAIDPVTTTNGPLFYYPKSHLIEPFRFSHGKTTAIISELKTTAAAHIETIIEQHALKKEFFLPQPGDVLIWHAQLLHGGSPIVDPAETRCSLVTHYWTQTDFPDPAQRIDLGGGRWLLKRHPMFVVDAESLAEVDAFLATLTVTDQMRAGIPDNFDPRLYLARNQDILRAGINPWQHYNTHGKTEGRVW